jgi:quinol monooxygenase YgiN
MDTVHDHIVVKPEYIDAFVNATIDNASNSVKEPGIARFDVIQQTDDPGRFTLVEVYRSPDDAPKHKQTGHYNR